jgi:trimeric autotransporter adhesin
MDADAPGSGSRPSRARKVTSYRDMEEGDGDFLSDSSGGEGGDVEMAAPAAAAPAPAAAASSSLPPPAARSRAARLTLRAAGLEPQSGAVTVVAPLPGYTAEQLLDGDDLDAAAEARAAAAAAARPAPPPPRTSVGASPGGRGRGRGRGGSAAAASGRGGGGSDDDSDAGPSTSGRGGRGGGRGSRGGGRGGRGRGGGGASRGGSTTAAASLAAAAAAAAPRTVGWGVVSGPVCVCQRPDYGGQFLMVPCADGTGGCNGWVHPSCCSLPRSHWQSAVDEAAAAAASAAAAEAAEEEAAADKDDEMAGAADATSSPARKAPTAAAAAVPAPTASLYRHASTKPFICPLCIRAAAVGKRERVVPPWGTFPVPLAPYPYVAEKIIARRVRRKTPEEVAEDAATAAAAAAAKAAAAAAKAAAAAAGGAPVSATDAAPDATPAAAPPHPQQHPHAPADAGVAAGATALDAAHVPHVAGHAHLMTAEGLTAAGAEAAARAAVQTLSQQQPAAAAAASATSAPAAGEGGDASASSSSSAAAPPAPPAPAPAAPTVVEYLIKWRWRSYLHCTWETAANMVELEHALAQQSFYDPTTGAGSGASIESCRQRVAIRVAKFNKRANAERRSAAVQSLFSGGSRMDDDDEGGGGNVRGRALKKLFGADYGAAAEAEEEVVDGDEGVDDGGGDADADADGGDGLHPSINPEWTFAERVVASTAALGEDYYDLPGYRAATAVSADGDAADAPPPPPQVWGSLPLYLVKWKGLSYAECTWETGEDVGDDDAIRAFRVREALPDEVVVMQQWTHDALLHNPAWLKGVRKPAPFEGGGGRGRRKSRGGGAAGGGGKPKKRKRYNLAEGESDDDEDDGGDDSGGDDDSDEDADAKAARAAEAAARRAADAALSVGGGKVEPEDCAHLCGTVPRMPPPPPHAFAKVPESPVYGLPRAVVGAAEGATGGKGAGAGSSSSAAAAAPTIGAQATGPMATEGAGLRLHPYQVEGLNWLLFNLHQGRGCILADVSAAVAGARWRWWW